MAGKGIRPTRSSAAGRRPRQPAPAKAAAAGRPRAQTIPEPVANRMARRIAVASGIPTLLGMGVFVGSYVLVSQEILAIPTAATLAASGACFLLGVLGLSYGVLSASWEEQPGSRLGMEHVGVNLGRLRTSLRAMRKGGESSSGNPGPTA